MKEVKNRKRVVDKNVDVNKKLKGPNLKEINYDFDKTEPDVKKGHPIITFIFLVIAILVFISLHLMVLFF